MSKIQFINFSEKEFPIFLKEVIDIFAEELTIAGNFTTKSEAVAFAHHLLKAKFFTSGFSTPTQEVFHILASKIDKKVGFIWYANSYYTDDYMKSARICYIKIFDEYKRNGYGFAAMQKAEEKLAEQGIDKITLNVFSRNINAKQLYEKLGYKIVKEINGKCEMQKLLISDYSKGNKKWL